MLSYHILLLEVAEASHLCLPGRTIGWLLFDNMHQQWLLLAACFWVIFMFMVASKFITLTFKDPDGRYASWLHGRMQHCSPAAGLTKEGRWGGGWLC